LPSNQAKQYNTNIFKDSLSYLTAMKFTLLALAFVTAFTKVLAVSKVQRSGAALEDGVSLSPNSFFCNVSFAETKTTIGMRSFRRQPGSRRMQL
jgi:hypothetical protein